MRIKNISPNSNNIAIRLTLQTTNSGYAQIELPYGHFVYGEIMDNNSSLRVYTRKNLIEIIDEDKPEKFEYYKVYDNSLTDEVVKIEEKPKNIIMSDEMKKSILERDNLSRVEEVSIEKDEEILEIEIIVPEEAIKNKGGRPKGVKNKPKKGRPKNKKKKR